MKEGWWNDKRTDALKVGWLAGLSASEIARQLRTSRCAVMGKVHRLGLTRPRCVQEAVRALQSERVKARLADPELRERLGYLSKEQKACIAREIAETKTLYRDIAKAWDVAPDTIVAIAKAFHVQRYASRQSARAR